MSLAIRIIQWFTGAPDEYNPTNYYIKNYLEIQDGRDATPEDRDIPTSASPFPTPVNVEDTKTSNLLTSSSLSSSSALVHSSPPSQSLSLTQSQPSQVQKYLHQAEFYQEKGPIQPEVWPTKEEFQLAKKGIQYDPEKLHFAVCGGSGAGKSSLINAFRGLKSNSPQAARTGVDENTIAITRYPDPRKELPYKRFVWYDCPGAGTLKTPGWKYFNTQGLFIFDIIILVYATVIILINSYNVN
jgi:Interferon-inducible GTPase (IIGP)